MLIDGTAPPGLPTGEMQVVTCAAVVHPSANATETEAEAKTANTQAANPSTTTGRRLRARR
jgi:hypothetical protein